MITPTIAQLDRRRRNASVTGFVAGLILVTFASAMAAPQPQPGKTGRRGGSRGNFAGRSNRVHTPAPVAVVAAEMEMFKRVPVDMLQQLSRGGRPDKNGDVGQNQPEWQGPSYQSGAMLYLIAGALRGDSRQVDDAWRAIDVAFAKQKEDGTFEHGPVGFTHSNLAAWLANLSHALLVLRESSLGSRYQDRIQALTPKITKSIQYLKGGVEPLMHADHATTNRIFFDAEAFGYTGLLLNDNKLIQTGKFFLDEGLRRQRPEGYFPEHYGSDSSYNAVSILQLTYLSYRFPDPRIDQALDRATKWELSRILPDGQVDVTGNTRTGLKQEMFLGKYREVRYPEVIESLLFSGVRYGNNDAIAMARKIYLLKIRPVTGQPRV